MANRKQRRNTSENMLLSELFASKPNEVQAQESVSTVHYKNFLLRLLKGHFVTIGLPDDWDRNYLLDNLLTCGVICVAENNTTPLPLRCTASGLNVFDRPTQANIANPVLGSFERTIGVDTELIYLDCSSPTVGTFAFKNVNLALNIYAQRLANIDKVIDTNIFTSMTTKIFSAPNGKVAQSLKRMFDEIQEGNPAVFVDSQTGMNSDRTNVTTISAKDEFIADKLEILKRQVIQDFLSEFGINNANTEKRERLNTDEVNANNEELEYSVALWRENLKICCDKVNKMFGLNILIDISERGAGENESSGLTDNLSDVREE